MVSTLALPGLAADWTVSPIARSGMEYDFNPVLVPTDSFAYVGSAVDLTEELSGKVGHQTDHSGLTLSPRADFNYFPGNAFLDHNDQYLDASANYNFERTSWAATSQLAHDTTLISEVGTTGLTEGNRRHDALAFTAGPSYQLTELLTLTAQGAFQRVVYENSGGSGLVDYNYAGVIGSATYLATEKMKLALDAAVNRLYVSAEDLVTTSYQPTANLNYQLNELWSSSAALGPAYVTSTFSTYTGSAVTPTSGRYTGSTGSATLQRTGPVYNISGKISRDVAPTGQGVLTTRDQISLNAFRQLTEQLSMTVTAYYGQTRELPTNPFVIVPISSTGGGGSGGGGGSTPPVVGILPQPTSTVWFRNVQVAFFWQFAPNWQAQSLLNYRQQSVGQAGVPGTDADGYSVGLKITWNGNPRAFIH